MMQVHPTKHVSLGSHDPARSSAQLAAGVIFIAGFLILSAFVISGITQNIDAQLALAVNKAILGEVFTAIMIFSSTYGRECFWISIVGAMLLFGKRETRLLALELAALFLVGIFAGEALKSILFRPRPFEALSDIITRVPLDMDSSYPSGHAIIVSIGAFFCLAKFKRRFVALLLTFEAAIVCYSRVFVGMHYPLDIVAGIFLGMAIVIVGLAIFDRYLRDILNQMVSLLAKVLGDGLIIF